MGAHESTLLEEEVEEIRQECCYLSNKDIKRLFKRFQKLDRESRGSVARTDLMKVPDFAMNPLRERVAELFSSSDGLINFKQFCHALAPFHRDAPVEDKIKLLFRLYDVDGDGKVSREDVLAVLKQATGTEDKLNERLAADVLRGAESLTYEEFRATFPVDSDEEVRSKMSIKFPKSENRVG
eukprot:m51a1_g4630 hypothetical protein (182) ;mRNA; r:325070-325921